MRAMSIAGTLLAAVLLALVQFGIMKSFFAVGGYMAVNIGIGSVIEPRIMGRGLGLSPLVVFLSLVFWGWVLGPVGMLLSVPLTMTVKIALDSYEDTKWIGVLLGSEALNDSALNQVSEISDQEQTGPDDVS